MNTQFDRHAEALQDILKQEDTTGFWIVWSDSVEKSFAIGLGAVEDKFLGHGMFTTTEKTTHTPKYDSKSQTLQPNTKHGESQRLLRQSRRLDQAACLFNLLGSNPTAAVQQIKTWEEAYGN